MLGAHEKSHPRVAFYLAESDLLQFENKLLRCEHLAGASACALVLHHGSLDRGVEHPRAGQDGHVAYSAITDGSLCLDDTFGAILGCLAGHLRWYLCRASDPDV